MTVVSGVNGAVYLASGSSSSVTGQAMTDTGDHATYYITTTARRFWDRDATVTVKVDAATQDASLYTVDYAGGRVTFLTPLVGSEAVTVDVSYFTIAQVGEAKDWELSIDRDLLDATKFGDVAKTFIAGQYTASGKFTLWKAADSTMFDLLKNTAALSRIGLSLFENVGGMERWECFARISGDKISLAGAELLEEEVPFNVDGEVNYYSV